MKRILYIILFVFCLMNKSDGQEMGKMMSIGYKHSYTAKLNPMTGYSLSYIPSIRVNACGTVFHKLEISWLSQQSPLNDRQKNVYNFQYHSGIGIIPWKKRSNIYLGAGISTGLIRLYKDVKFDSLANDYQYGIRNKVYLGIPLRIDWIFVSRTWISVGLHVYGNFHRYKDFGGGLDLYIGKLKPL